MKRNKHYTYLLSLVGLFALSCGPIETIDRVPLKIVFTKLPDKFLKENKYLSPESINLLKGIILNSADCKDTIMLNATLVRADESRSEFSMEYISERSVLARTTAKREFKLLEDHLKKISIPPVLMQKVNLKSDSLFNIYNTSNKDLDSIITYSSKRQYDSLEINSKKYRSYSDVNEVRTAIQSIICNNPKASIAILIDPPVQREISHDPPNPPLGSTHTKSAVDKATGKSHRSNYIRPTGSLTTLKGSEGCDVCTRYSTAFDATGQRHEIREPNSTFCCPCGKTIEMRGRTYVMECEGGINRLVVAN